METQNKYSELVQHFLTEHRSARAYDAEAVEQMRTLRNSLASYAAWKGGHDWAKVEPNTHDERTLDEGNFVISRDGQIRGAIDISYAIPFSGGNRHAKVTCRIDLSVRKHNGEWYARTSSLDECACSTQEGVQQLAAAIHENVKAQLTEKAWIPTKPDEPVHVLGGFERSSRLDDRRGY